MTPSNFLLNFAVVFQVGSNGGLGDYGVDYTFGIRPVINLKADTSFTGSGTQTDPYVITE